MPSDEEILEEVVLDRTFDLFREMTHATDRVAAITCHAFLDDALGEAIGVRFIKLGVDWRERIFDNTIAPLNTFYAKMVIGYAMGMYGPTTRADMDLIRAVRNRFAHTANPVHFSDDEIVSRCLKLKTSRLFGELRLDDSHTPKLHYIRSSISIALELMRLATENRKLERPKPSPSLP